MPFQKGNKFGKGRPKGTGKRQNVSEAFQDFLAGKQSGKVRFDLAMERLFKDDLKTFFAYAYGKPIETQVLNNPDGTALSPITVTVVGGTVPQSFINVKHANEVSNAAKKENASSPENRPSMSNPK